MSLFSSNDELVCTPFALHNRKDKRRGQIENSRLEPENEYGNVEYKLRLTNPTPERIERLVTQLKWRIREGQGEAIIFLGVKDDGCFVGLTPEEIKLSLQTLERMSAKIGANMTIVREKIVEPEQIDVVSVEVKATNKNKVNRNNASNAAKHKENVQKMTCNSSCNNSNTLLSNTCDNNGKSSLESKTKKPASRSYRRYQTERKVIQVLVKRKTHDISEELRVAVLGPTESGKSSLLGVLSHGEYDNGRGSARLNLFRHRHEIQSGQTSSISQEIFGLNSNGQPLTYNTCLTTEEIIEASSRIVTLIDLAGHQRYLNTTLFGLGSYSPRLLLIVVSAISPITDVITDNISLALGMEKSVAIVINKIDLTPKDDQYSCYHEITRALNLLHPDITPYKVSSLNEAIAAGSKLEVDQRILPIFFTSCVTGVGMSFLYAFLNEISPELGATDLSHAISRSPELQVDGTFDVPGIGTVVSGLMIEGTIREGDEMLLGPDDRGNFSTVTIVSLQRHKIPCNFVRAGQKCTLAISTSSNIKLRKGMVMKEVDADWKQNFSVCLQFRATLRFITNEHQKLGPGNQVSIYVGNVKQTCTIVTMKPSYENSWLVEFKLTKRPEYLREGSKIIIRHAFTKALGVVDKVKQLHSNQGSPSR